MSMPENPLTDLEREARAVVATVADDPHGRLEMRREFYRRYGFHHLCHGDDALHTHGPGYGFGRSELDFMSWEIERGVLNRLDDRVCCGSRWWRDVNLDFLYDGELAVLARSAGLPAATLPVGARHWGRYLESPGVVTWYRAHNASIVAGYLRHPATAAQERRSEQRFMNVVLYRLLYAQAMVEGFELPALGRALADPRLPSVDLLVHLPDFYPRHYPLSKQDIAHVMHRGHSAQELLVDLMDIVFIHPDLGRLYARATSWLGIPALRRLVEAGEPAYPEPSGRRLRTIARVRRFLGGLLRDSLWPA